MIFVTSDAGLIGCNFVLNWIAACDEPVPNLDLLTHAGELRHLESLRNDPASRDWMAHHYGTCSAAAAA